VSGRILFLAAVVACAAGTAGSASAQTPARDTGAPMAATNFGRVVGGAYDRSHDYDLVHQRIEVGGFDWDSTAFRGRVVTELVARRAGMDSVVLDAGHLLRIRQVTDATGPLAFHNRGDTLVVLPRRPARFGDTLRFTMVYGGKVENGRGLTFIKEQGPHRPRQIWSQGEAMDNHLWFPTYDFPNDRATWELVATVPAGFTAVSNGRLVARTRNADGTVTFDWSEGRPSSTYLVSLVVAPLVKLHDAWRTVPVDYYVYRADSAKAWPLFHITPDMIDVYSRLTGIPYPWEKYAQTTVADFFGGMENVSATTLLDGLPDARQYQDRPWYRHILIPHELAHQWFGDYVTTEDWANTWLNEGFAEFMPGQYWGERLGRHGEEDYYLDEYRQFMQIDARRRMPVAAEGSNNIYPKGALVLEMLKELLGPEAFWASIHRYLDAHALGNATTDDLRQAILEATGQNLDWFFNQWLYAAGYPEFDVAATYDPAGRRLTLHVRQTQQDTARADSTGLRFETPTVFRTPVAVRVETASGDVTRRFLLDRREQALVLDSIAEPRMVAFDEGNAILKKLTFPQTTAWLAQLLRHEAGLWQRQWAIDQLASRKDDPAAAKALAEAATGADYFLTRAGATTALGGLPAEAALPAVETALRDTSSAVRAAAVQALGQLGGPRAAELSRTAFERDSSDAVRGAALMTVARVDTTGRGALIRRALDSESESMRGAAFNAVALSRDTSFVPQLEAHLADGFGPAFALGALAGAGSTRALGVLVSHLDDERSTVRRAALAVLQRLPPALVAGPLRAALPGIRDETTRRAVQRLLDRPAAPPAGP